MSRNKSGKIMIVLCIIGVMLLGFLSVLQNTIKPKEEKTNLGSYESLPEDISQGEPLAHIGEDFMVDEGFYSNLPIVILQYQGELPEYKDFDYTLENTEVVYEVEPYTEGSIRIVDSGDASKVNYVTDVPVYTSNMKVKKRGHTSYKYDKPQYLMKMYDETGIENTTEILGMGEGSSWILNGSMADKSMIRNYLPYRIASEIGGGCFAPDSKYCEVLLETEAGLKYQGVYLLQETVSRGKSRVDIGKSRDGKNYTSYLVRRDRFTHFDTMLDTYGRLNGFSEEWIGIKYPGENKLTEKNIAYIEEDFSTIEKVLYAEDEGIFKTYDRHIDVDSFVDYFLINEFFGNYDAGNHSTYMYKDFGGKLHIGPVWDFDQAMNNYYADEMETETLAFQVKPFYDQLCKDARFIDALKKRYATLRKGALSEAHITEIIDETVAHLTSAREREWYRWAEDYLDDSFQNPGNYYLRDYIVDGTLISRFNDDYSQEIYNIKNYLHKHGNTIQTELSKLQYQTIYNTDISNENELFLLVVMILFLLPSILINRKK